MTHSFRGRLALAILLIAIATAPGLTGARSSDARSRALRTSDALRSPGLPAGATLSSRADARSAPLPARAAQTDPAHFVVVVPNADLFRSASIDADVVSQAPFGSDVVALESNDTWARIRTASDEYVGWVLRSDLKREDPAALYGTSGKVATVSMLFASIYREPNIEKHRPIITIPFGSPLEITGEMQVPDGLFFATRLPTGTSGWVQSGDVTFETKLLSIPETIELARRFIGLPYRWGGTTTLGFDCSGFTQLLMRRRGVSMPRDTGPQSRWGGTTPVERTALEPGDLLFFGKAKKVNHTGLYIGDGEFIHATRHKTPAVQISRLADEPWNTLFISARRSP